MDVSKLIESLRSSEPVQRSEAAQELAKLGEAAQPAAVPLVETCADSDSDAFEWVVAALEQLGPPAKNDLAKLATLAGNEAQDVAYWAITLLGRAKREAQSAVDALAHTLDTHAESSVRQRAAWALGEIGVATEPARSALKNAAAASDRRLATLAGEALKRLSG